MKSLWMRAAVFLVAILAAAALASCAQEPPAAPEAPVEEEVEAPAEPAGPSVYRMGIFEEPITRNFWNYYGGAGGSVWTQYVLSGYTGGLYGYSDQTFEWIPSLAADFPTDLTKETVDGTEYWTTEVPIRAGIMWSDGEELTADDVIFTAHTVLEMGISGNFGAAVDSAFLDRIEAIDSHRIKIFFKANDDEGNPQTPGLSVWQFGLAFMPILPEHYWAPVVEEAKKAGDAEAQIEALMAHVPENDPTLGGFVFAKWEAGAFLENERADNYYATGSVITRYASGTLQEQNERLGYTATYFGEPGGDKELEYTVGPHVDSALFSIYGNQDAAILALTKGDIDYVFNPLGLEKGFRERIQAAGDLEIVTNLDNGMFYLGFNVRKEPMNIREFRQAVAIMIDKEFVTQTVLQGAAIPAYSMVPSGNAAWFNADTPSLGANLSRGERLQQAVELLKSAGFTYEEEPEISEDGNFVAKAGKGLKLPDGSDVPALTIIAPSAGYDPLRATFAIWIERWLNDVGIPVRANLTGFNVIVGVLFSDTVQEDLDMWILGWSLSLFPDYLEVFFNSRHAPENEGGYNWGGYANPEFDDISFSLLSETTIEGARDKVFQLQNFLAEDLPYVTLFTIPKLDSYRPASVEFPYTEVLGGLEGVGGMQTAVQVK